MQTPLFCCCIMRTTSKMKYMLLLAQVLLAFLFLHPAGAQTTRTVGGAGANYLTLKLAFDAINAGSITGAITLQITGNTTETTAAVLNASGTGSANYSSVSIYPTATGKTISGNVATPLIDLNGADNVTLDGRLNASGSAKDLVITNTNTGAASSTIRLYNSAENNIIRYCTLKGSSTNTTGGVLFFSTAASGNGNDGNIINNNSITADAAGKPVNGIYSSGTAGYENSGNTISNNYFFDLLNRGASSNDIYLSSNSTGWAITGNSFYETASLNPTAGATYNCIQINNISGVNFTVTDNFIGGTAPSCGGIAFAKTNSNNNIFNAINLSVGTGTASSVQNNTIQNISWSNSANALWTGINIAAGDVNTGTVTGNTIGATTGAGSVTVSDATTAAYVYGIAIAGGGIANVQNNNVGSVTAANTGLANATNFFGIYRTNTNQSTISGNTIGSTVTAGSIQTTCASTGDAQCIYGIYNTGAGTVTLNGNIVSNLTNATSNATAATAGSVNGIFSTSGTNTIANNTISNLTIANANTSGTIVIAPAVVTPALCGIALYGSTIKTITGNTIYNLSNSYASFAGNVIGLYFTGSTGSNTVSGNFIYGLSITGASSTAATLYGIKMNTGATTYFNNIISLGGNTKTTIYGIYETGAAGNNNTLYFNTVYIGGSLVSGSTNKSYSLYSAGTANTRDFRNNIFTNARSTTGGASLHYGVFFNYGASTGLTLDYNDYFISGTGGVPGNYNNADVYLLPLVAGQDASSVMLNPLFSNAGGTAATDYKPSSDKIAAITMAAVPTDYASLTRAGTPTMGAFEGTLNLNVDVYKAGVLQGTYLRLKDAFDKINSGLHTGALELRVKANTTEAASAVLYWSGYTGAGGTSNYSSVNIFPTITGITVTGNLNMPLIDLSGADYVTFDGRVNQTGSLKDLTITNTSTGTSASTFRFLNSAENNTVKYCTVKGSGTNATGGIIFISTSTAGNGNDGNTIDHNYITADAAGRPLNAIYSEGSQYHDNSGNIISNNNIFNFLNPATASNGIFFSSSTTACTISGNSFYETAPFAPTASVAYNIIQISNLTGINYSVINNFIGGSAASCGGTAWTKTSSGNNTFNAIYLNAATGTASSLQNNTIQNITWSNSYSAVWTCINIAAGDVNIGTATGNTIGANTGTGSVTMTAGENTPYVYGIYLATSGTVNCQNNTIGSVTAAITDGNKGNNFYGIYKTAVGGTTTISNNLIGSNTTANSIQTSSTSMGNGQNLYGISSDGTGSVTISGNSVVNLKNAQTSFTGASATIGIQTTAGSNTIQNNTVGKISSGNGLYGLAGTSSVTGIVQRSTTSGTTQTVTGNIVFNISSTNPSAHARICGIFYQGPASGTNTVSGNFIRDLSLASSDAGADADGIFLYDGMTTCANNIISLGTGITTGYALNGIWDNGGASNNNNIWFNSVYIGGTISSGTTSTTSPLYGAANNSTRNYRDNVLDNARSGGTTGKHYALYLSGISSLTIDYNDYFADGTNGMLAYVGADKSTLALLAAATGQDSYSLNLNPSFTNPGGTAATDYRPLSDKLAGVTISAVPTDYSLATRAGTPTMGALETVLNLNIDVYKAGVIQLSCLRLRDVFDKINNGTLTGALEVKIKASLVENASDVLYQSGYTGAGGTSNYSSVTIYPTVTGITISGDFAAPLVDFNGADNVTFDGRVNQTGSTPDLTLTNVNTSASSTIRFINTAENNTIRYCTIKGAETSAAGGIIFFSAATAGNGNDGNLIDNNVITSDAAGRPVNVVYSEGTTSHENSGNTISNNTIYNFFNTALASNGISLYSNTSACSVTGNNFYETTIFAPTTSVEYSVIRINNASGINFNVSGNYIGGSTVLCGSLPWTKTNSNNNTFYAIYLNAGTGTVSSIQNNTIQNISWSNSYAAYWTGIYLAAGNVNIGTTAGNTVGSPTGNGSITVTDGDNPPYVYGINIASTGTINCLNNSIGSITAAITDPSKGNNVIGINKTAGAGTTTISNNLIGSTTTANSIQASSTSTGMNQTVIGIDCDGTGTTTISGNTVMNLKNGQTSFTGSSPTIGIQTTAGSNTITNNTVGKITTGNALYGNLDNNSVTGIMQLSTTNGTTQTVNNNTVFELSNSNPNSHVRVTGIFFQGPKSGTNSVSANFVHDLSLSSSDIGAIIDGIVLYDGLTTSANNIISLGTGITTGYVIDGIIDNSGNSNNNSLYFNTIYIGGTVTSGTTSNTADIINSGTNSTRDYRDNILMNARSGGATGKNYAIYLSGTNGLTINYNDYFVTGSNGVLAYLNGDKTTLSAIISATGQDAGSSAVNPLFSNPGGTTAPDYNPNAVISGVAISGITTDYTGATRTNPPTLGALESSFIEVWKSGSLQAKYTQLKSAFDAINVGAHTGTLEIRITGSVIELASAVLNASGTVASNFSSINIYPTGPGISITGNLATPLIDLNGADNVTIDGRVNATGSSTSLTITNSSTSATSGTSTIRLVNSAENNVVKYCLLRGGSTASPGGIVLFSGTVSGNSNKGNLVDNCTLTGLNTTDRPLYAIYSYGSSGHVNSNNTVSNNIFYDFLSPTASSSGINLNSFSSDWTISGNSFYESGMLAPTGSFIYCGIKIANTSGNNFAITDNFIGGSSSQCGGTTWTINANYNYRFYCIQLDAGTTTASSIQHNTMKNFSLVGGGDTPWTGIDVNSGNANVGTVTGNTIGDATGTGSILISTPVASGSSSVTGGVVTSVSVTNGGTGYTAAPLITFSGGAGSGATATASVSGGVVTGIIVTNGGSGYTSNPSVKFNNSNGSSTSYGIHVNSPATVTISNNTIASVTTSGTTDYSAGFTGIMKQNSTGTTTITNNQVGSMTTSNSIQASTSSTTATAQNVYGIASAGSGAITISGNTIANLFNAYAYQYSTNGQLVGISTSAGVNTIQNNIVRNLTATNESNDANGNAAIIGIAQKSTSAGQTVTGNTIYALNSTYTGGRSVNVTGIYFTCSAGGTNTVSGNFIHSFSLAAGSPVANPAALNGIRTNSGSCVISNNVINLGNTVSGGYSVFGIYENGTSGNSNSILFNSVYIGGVVGGSTASATTCALFSNANTNTRDFRNNILYNARSGGTTGKHYAISVAGNSNLTIDYNDYFVSGTNGMTGNFAGTDKSTLATWQAATGQDANSLSINPLYANAGGTSATNYYTTALLPGVAGTGIITDYFGLTRNLTPKMGALERNSFTWKGTVSTNFGTASNWIENEVPAAGSSVTFDASPVNHCSLDINRTIGDLNNAQGAKKLIVNKKQLILNGNLNFTNGAQIDASDSASGVVFAGFAAQTIPAGAFVNNMVYNLTVNNPNNVTMTGTLAVLNAITSTSGRLDAHINTPTLILAGSAAQSIGSSVFLNDTIYNLNIDNGIGVTLNTNLTVINALTINPGKILAIAPLKELNAQGSITNSAGKTGLIIRSDSTGTASLLHNTSNLPATVQRYISGAIEAWHFLSTPVSNQNISENQGTSDSWLPSGNYGNGTGYDLYVWNESTNCWIYKSNTTATVNWNTVHPGADFVPGRGYLYSVQALNPTKVFSGNLNNGSVSYGLTSAGPNTNLAGFNLVGNPYPSTIDWGAASGWSRSCLVNSAGGYDMWIWSPAANNYGVYNSNDGDGIGTNSATRYIAPMQGFFVRTATTGTLAMDNPVRVANNAPWFKSSEQEADKISLSVVSEEGSGSDEIKLSFGYSAGETGSRKLFSEVATAPSLYMPRDNENFSVRFLTNTLENPSVPLIFAPGTDGNYTLTCNFEQSRFDILMLEDRQAHCVQDLKTKNIYLFQSSSVDIRSRFILHFKADSNATYKELPARIFTRENRLVVDLTLITRETDLVVYDELGRPLLHQMLQGENIHSLDLPLPAQVLIVYLKNPSGTLWHKLMWLGSR